MPAPTVGQGRVRFGQFDLDLRSGDLWKDGARLVLPNQPLRILTLLIRQPGELVTRDELRRDLWPEDTFVDFERSLNAGVRRLRDVLGDSAAAPVFIETIPQRGYRFITPVQQIPAPVQQIALPSSVTSSYWQGRRVLIPATAVIALISVLIALQAFHGRTEPDAPFGTLLRLTSTSGLNTDPALSHDGSLVAYASDRGNAGDFDIYVQTVGGGEPVRLTNDPSDDSEPSFSSDGAYVVFSRRDKGLYVTGALGGTSRLLVPAPWARTPRFSPDGRWISYWTGFPASVVAGGIPGALGSTFIVASEGGSPRAIATHLASARYPVWSPDGRHILFLGEEDAEQKTHDWYVVALDGGKAIKTGAVQALRAAGLSAAFPIPGTWSADGTVVFATNESGTSNVWQLRVSPSTGLASGVPQRLTFGSAIERNPVATASGRIAFASIVENVDIWRLPLDGTGFAAGPLERVTDNAASDKLRHVSSDGRRLSFISSRTNRDEVWIKDLETGQERLLTHAGVDEASASPDGSSVAFSRSAEGKHSIDIVRAEQGLPSRLCDGCSDPAGWSPDGTRLIYAAGAPFRLLLHDFSSGARTELTTHPTWSLERARFSPDGQWMAFHTANSPNVRQVYAAPVALDRPVSADRWVPIVTDHGCHPSWSADGAQVYHFSFRDGSFCPWVQRVDRATRRPIGAPRAVTHFHHPRLRAASGAAAFNDVQAGYLYMTLTEASGNIWMIDRGNK